MTPFFFCRSPAASRPIESSWDDSPLCARYCIRYKTRTSCYAARSPRGHRPTTSSHVPQLPGSCPAVRSSTFSHAGPPKKPVFRHCVSWPSGKGPVGLATVRCALSYPSSAAHTPSRPISDRADAPRSSSSLYSRAIRTHLAQHELIPSLSPSHSGRLNLRPGTPHQETDRQLTKHLALDRSLRLRQRPHVAHGKAILERARVARGRCCRRRGRGDGRGRLRL